MCRRCCLVIHQLKTGRGCIKEKRNSLTMSKPNGSNTTRTENATLDPADVSLCCRLPETSILSSRYPLSELLFDTTSLPVMTRPLIEPLLFAERLPAAQNLNKLNMDSMPLPLIFRGAIKYPGCLSTNQVQNCVKAYTIILIKSQVCNIKKCNNLINYYA